MLDYYRLLTNEDAAKNEENGILEEHYEMISKFAIENNVIVIIRSVNWAARNLFKLGYPTKGIDVKAKSCDRGICAGFIISSPVLNFLSKTGLQNNENHFDKIKNLIAALGTNLKKVDWSNNKVAEKLLNLSDNEMFLEISQERFDYLINEKRERAKITDTLQISDKIWMVKNLININVNNDNISEQNQIKTEETIFTVIKNDKNNYQIYYTFAVDKQDNPKNLEGKSLVTIWEQEKNDLILIPLPVYCQEVKGIKKPLIPDYDIWAVFWELDKGVKWFQPDIPTNSFKRRASFSSDENIYGKIGNGSKKTPWFLNLFNKALNYEGIDDKCAPFQHSWEFFNPETKQFYEDNLTVFVPKGNFIGFEQNLFYFTLVKFKNINELIQMYFNNPLVSNEIENITIITIDQMLKMFQSQGYYVYININIKQTLNFGITKPGENKFLIEDQKIRKQRSKSESDCQFLTPISKKIKDKRRTLSEGTSLTAEEAELSKQLFQSMVENNLKDNLNHNFSEKISDESTYSLSHI